jgi:glycosyltransferase involved in cell wall biosynthesis
VSGRVLVVAYYFPPLGGVGVQRTLKYVKYLPAAGWTPIVVTPANPAYMVRDESLLDELPPEVSVERTGSFEPARLPNAIAGWLARRRTPSGGGPRDATVGPAGAGLPARVLMKGMILWNRIWGLLLFPDAAVGWVGSAVRRGLAIHRRAPVDVIYSTSAPISCHLIAGRIAARTGLPWIADFRDPWIGNAFATPPRGWHAIQQRRIERRIVDGADTIVFATDGLRQAYAARYPSAAARMRVIPNGYDRADFAAPGVAGSSASEPAAGPVAGSVAGPATVSQAGSRAGDGRFRLVYTGSLYGERELEILLRGLELLAGRRPEIRERLEIEFVGWLSAHNRTVAARAAGSPAIGPILRFSGFVPHAEAMRKAAAADALLQLIADDPRKGEVQGGKLMEYLGFDRQILAVVPEGAAREVLRELDWGVVADPTPEGVADGIERLLSQPAPARRADPEGRYDRANLAARLGALLDEAVETAARTAPGSGPAGTGR